MTRAELDEDDMPTPAMLGSASTRSDEGVDDHPGHAFLYVPDLSSRTGWAAHAVPTKEPEPQRRHPLGFRRGDR